MTLIIIVTYNGEYWIENCIESLIQEPNSDIFVIDCNSSDRTREILAGYKDKLTLHFSNKNLGFGKANNLGLRYALENGYNYVFLVNQDTVSTKGIINKLKAAHQTHPQYGILSPLHFYSKEVLDCRFESYLKKSQTRTFTSLLSEDEVIPVDFVNAAFWFIPIDVIKELGGFDPIFRHYGEDDDYANRIKNSGRCIGVVKNAITYHLRDQTSKSSVKLSYLIQKYKNSYLIILKNPQIAFEKAIITYIYNASKWLIVSLFRSKFTHVISILIAYLLVFKSIPKILYHRNYYNNNFYGKYF